MATEVTLTFGVLSLAIPLIAALVVPIILFFGKRLKPDGAYIALAATGLNFILSLLVSLEVLFKMGEIHGEAIWPTYKLFTWFYWPVNTPDGVKNVPIEFATMVDPLAALVLLLVSLVSFLVVLYSLKYMEHDSSPRYFAEIAMFSAAMLGLTLSANFLVFFLCWELMGLMSYLLIGYYYYKDNMKPHPAWASKKAFLMTKIGDVLFFVGFILLFLELAKNGEPTFNFITMAEFFSKHPDAIPSDKLFLIGVLIFGGAIGKSAQFPLHTWLPDAMAGPTTVSCLIHSATMVKAGIYLIARTSFLYNHTDQALLFVALIGGITALMAGTMALTNTDIKGILAYSTISQLGYMTIGLGIAGFGVAIFHVLSHGLFKALLFLSAGSVIHAVHTQDIREMGGLRKDMKITAYTMLIGIMALSGIPGLNGFFSKDAIILSAWLKFYETQSPIYGFVFLSALLTAPLTAFYAFRLWVVVFMGDKPRNKSHPHESPKEMWLPLVTLAGLATLMGLIAIPGLLFPDLSLERFFVTAIQGEAHEVNDGLFLIGNIHVLTITSAILAIGGAAFAWFVYWPAPNEQLSFNDFTFEFTGASPETLGLRAPLRNIALATKKSLRPIQTLLENNYYIDSKLYGPFGWFVYNTVAEATNFIDNYVIDALVNAVGYISFVLVGLAKFIDEVIIDGAVNGTAYIIGYTGAQLRKLQIGKVEFYGAAMAVGAAIIISTFVLINLLGLI